MTAPFESKNDPEQAGLEGLSVSELAARLREAEETIDAIRNGEVDAVVVGGPSGQQVYTLQNADRPYRVLIEQMQEGAVTLSGDGTVLYCNQCFATIIGIERENIIGHTITRFFGDAEIGTFLQLLARGLNTGASGEFVLHGAGIAAVPVNISLIDLKVDEETPRVVCCVVTDLTHSRRRTHELAAANILLGKEIEERRRAEGSLQLALDAAGMASWDLDLATRLVRRSVPHDRIFGHTRLLPAWHLETTLDQFLPEDRAAVAKAFAQASTSGAIEFEKRIRRSSDGAIRWLQVKGRTYYELGKPVRIAGIVADVTEFREIEERMRQAQKMEAVGHLTGGIAHDFNNLLTVILGNLETMQRRLGATATDLPQLRKLAEAATRGAQHAASLTQRLLAFSRHQPLDPKVLDANKLVSGMSDLLGRALGEQIAIEAVLNGDLWRTFADPNQLESAILNLAINARDAMPDGGTLTIATSNVDLDRAYANQESEVTPGSYVLIAIADTGIGMTKEVIAQAFDPFFTTKDTGQGTGLGLSQVYGFVKQSGGHAKIVSTPEAGTTVKIYLPRFAGQELPNEVEPETELPAAVPERAPARDRAETILVVDDDNDVRSHSTDIVRELGYRVIEASTGRAALEILDREPEIALLFSDVGLPGGMNGKQLADEAHRRHPHLKILFTSGYAKSAIVHDGRLDAGVQLVAKPFTFAILAKKISEMLKMDANVPTILVVEDDELVRMVAVDALELLGFRVEEAGSAREATDKFRAAPDSIQAALIDVGLPDQKGDELALTLRGIAAKLPIVIVSGYGSGIAQGPLKNETGIGFLGKPYGSTQLAAMLATVGIDAPAG